MDVRQRTGHNLRRARDTVGFSLADLASVSGVSKSTLHEIETGGANPRLETLYAIANALGLGLADLLEPAGELIDVRRRDDGPTVTGDAITARLIHRLAASGHVELYELQIQPRLHESAPHTIGTREWLIVHEGRLQVGPSTDPRTLDAGDAIWFAADRPHLYRACGDEPAHATLAVIHP